MNFELGARSISDGRHKGEKKRPFKASPHKIKSLFIFLLYFFLSFSCFTSEVAQTEINVLAQGTLVHVNLPEYTIRRRE